MGRLSIYTHEDGRSAVHDDGFSWLAAMALPLWALQRRLYKTFFVMFLSLLVLHDRVGRALQHVADEALSGWLGLAWVMFISLLAGWLAGRWHRHVLCRAGYELSATEQKAAS